MSLRDRLTAWRRPVRLSEERHPPSLAQAKIDIERMLGASPVDLPSSDDRSAIYRQVLLAYRGGGLAGLSRRVLKVGVWVVFESWDHEPPLVADAKFAAQLETEVRTRGNLSTMITLAQALLLHFDPNNATHVRLRGVARDALEKNPRPRARRFLAVANRFGLFRPDGPTVFAEQLLNASAPAETVLADAGLTGPLAYHGFVKYCFEELARLIHTGLTNSRIGTESLARVLQLAEAPVGAAESRLRFPLSENRKLVESLLLPFESKDPEGSIQSLIKSFLLHRIGDPRLDRERWNGIAPRAQQVIRRWLVAATLGDFFKVLDSSMRRGTDADADRHWPFRRAFWTAYLESGQISEAWVVLGWRVAIDTRHVLSELSANYGKLSRSSPGARPSHAVLIMQIGSLVITEWSHAGKYRVWDAENPSAPKLYRREYHRGELVAEPDFEGTHHGAENGRWQQKLSRYIANRTGYNISLRELMPKT